MGGGRGHSEAPLRSKIMPVAPRAAKIVKACTACRTGTHQQQLDRQQVDREQALVGPAGEVRERRHAGRERRNRHETS